MFSNYVSAIMFAKKKTGFVLIAAKERKKLERTVVNIFKRNLMSLKPPPLQHFISRGLCLMNLISLCIGNVIKTSVKIITLISSNSSRIYMLPLTRSL